MGVGGGGVIYIISKIRGGWGRICKVCVWWGHYKVLLGVRRSINCKHFFMVRQN